MSSDGGSRTGQDEGALTEVTTTVPHTTRTWGFPYRWAAWRRQRLSTEFPEELRGLVEPPEYAERTNLVNQFLDRQHYLRTIALITEAVDLACIVAVIIMIAMDSDSLTPFTRVIVIFLLLFHIVTMNVVRLKRLKAQEELDGYSKNWSSQTVNYILEQKGIWLSYQLTVKIVARAPTQVFDPDPEFLPPPPPVYVAEEPPPPDYSLQPPQPEYPPVVTSLPPPKRFSTPTLSITVEGAPTGGNAGREGRDTPLITDASSVYEVFGNTTGNQNAAASNESLALQASDGGGISGTATPVLNSSSTFTLSAPVSPLIRPSDKEVDENDSLSSIPIVSVGTAQQQRLPLPSQPGASAQPPESPANTRFQDDDATDELDDDWGAKTEIASASSNLRPPDDDKHQ